jgi:hypothetical protein
MPRSLSHRSYPHCSPFPPREQLLAAAVGGAVVVVAVVWSSWWPLVISSSPSPPPSSPGRSCRHRLSSPSPLSSPSCVCVPCPRLRIIGPCFVPPLIVVGSWLSTRDPPREQGLTTVVVGTGHPLSLSSSPHRPRLPRLPRLPLCRPVLSSLGGPCGPVACNPPYEQ